MENKWTLNARRLPHVAGHDGEQVEACLQSVRPPAAAGYIPPPNLRCAHACVRAHTSARPSRPRSRAYSPLIRAIDRCAPLLSRLGPERPAPTAYAALLCSSNAFPVAPLVAYPSIPPMRPVQPFATYPRGMSSARHVHELNAAGTLLRQSARSGGGAMLCCAHAGTILITMI
jgi:hypothetical protein